MVGCCFVRPTPHLVQGDDMSGEHEVKENPRFGGSEGPLFWIPWHILAVALVVTLPPYYRWGAPVQTIRIEWVPQVVVMGMAYLGLATLLGVARPRRSVGDVASMALAGILIYAAAFLLLRARSDMPVSRLLVAGSAMLGSSLAILPVLLGRRRWYGFGFPAFLLVGGSIRALVGPADLIPLQVELGTRSLSKLPFVIALDQGLYEKHGLDVRLFMPSPEFEGGVEVFIARLGPIDIRVDGQTPMMVRSSMQARYRRRISLEGACRTWYT